MAWIRKIEPDQAAGKLADIYDLAKKRAGKIFEILKIQSLRPDQLEAWIRLYAAIMHAPSGLSRVERELVAAVVSRTNGCRY